MSDLLLNNLEPWIQTDAIHQELVNVKYRVYNPLGFKCSQPVMEPESAEYGAYRFE
jgi:hypothetical protein